MVTGHECSEEERPGDPSQDEILSLADSSPCMLRVLGGVPAKLSDLDIRSSRRVTAAYVFVVEEEVGGGAGNLANLLNTTGDFAAEFVTRNTRTMLVWWELGYTEDQPALSVQWRPCRYV